MARNTRTFTDIDLNFGKHPVTHDLNVVYDVQAIKGSIRNLILTSNYEKPFHPEIGSPVRSLLFEPDSPLLSVMIEKAIRQTLDNFEPRVQVIAVTAKKNSRLGAIADAVIDISFDKEADPNGLAPTTSTTLTIAIGDALAAALITYKNFSAQDFGKRHPGGALGKKSNG